MVPRKILQILSIGLFIMQIDICPCLVLPVRADEGTFTVQSTLQVPMRQYETTRDISDTVSDIEAGDDMQDDSAWLLSLAATIFPFVRRRQEVAIFNFEILRNEPGVFDAVIGKVNDADPVASCQLIPVGGNREVLSIRIKTRDKERLLKKYEHLSVNGAIRYIGNTLLVPAKQPDALSCARTDDLLLLKVSMPYTTKNLKSVLSLISRSNASIQTFLFPKFDERVQYLPSMLFELKVSDHTSIERVRDNLTAALDSSNIRKLSSIIHPRKTIADQLIEDLLDELVIDLRTVPNLEKQFKQIFSLFENHISLLRKDQQTPYIVHITKAVKIMVNECGVTDPVTIMALMLHDSVEDGIIRDDQLDYLTFLDNYQHIATVVRAISRKQEKEFRYEKPYLNAIVEAEPGLDRDRAILAKLCDRIQNLRSLNIGDPKFHQKVFMDTLLVFLPEFVDRIPLDPASTYYDVLVTAIDLLKCEIALRGRSFEFITPAGELDTVVLTSYFETQKLFTDADRDATMYVNDDGRRYAQLSMDYCAMRVRKLGLYSAAVDACADLQDVITDDDQLNSEVLTFGDPLLLEFFPYRIKSSSVQFMVEWFRRLHGQNDIASLNSDKRVITVLNDLTYYGVGKNTIAYYFAQVLAMIVMTEESEKILCSILKDAYQTMQRTCAVVPRNDVARLLAREEILVRSA